ncbi:MAG: 16S rRNA (guanine(527)-N(7))-methyltransferase RsmG [Phycisphaerales bacterium]|nr:16S rRNA (guanine(527)-N(7))-methyltransferase RsmG [Phycisphaerales bacterium]
MNVRPLDPTPQFLTEIASLGIKFDSGDIARLGVYLALLIEANRSFNLTRITEPGEAWMRHIFDSLTLLPLIASTGAQRVCDVGSGGGTPAIPLAICLPSVAFTLVESTGKKARFCEQAALDCDCENVTVITDRAETIGQDHRTHREAYDVVTARAVGRMCVVAELTAAPARVGGLVLLIKGEQAETELAEARGALDTLGLAHVETVPTPTGRVVVLEKQRKTPRLYPRRPGEPKRVPLR